MGTLLNNKYFLNKVFDLAKFVIIVGLFCFLIVKVPNDASRVIETAGAFILGGTKIRTKLGI